MEPTRSERGARADLHDTFLDGGLLGVLKAWLEPMPDGSLPNARVRAAVLHALAQLPIDVTDEGRKDQLKRSGVGKARACARGRLPPGPGLVCKRAGADSSRLEQNRACAAAGACRALSWRRGRARVSRG